MKVTAPLSAAQTNFPMLTFHAIVLKAYQLSSLSPTHWEVHDTDDTGVLSRGSVGTSVSGKGDEPDALSLRKGGTLA